MRKGLLHGRLVARKTGSGESTGVNIRQLDLTIVN